MKPIEWTTEEIVEAAAKVAARDCPKNMRYAGSRAAPVRAELARDLLAYHARELALDLMEFRPESRALQMFRRTIQGANDRQSSLPGIDTASLHMPD